jgi:hypothetical protein
MARKGNNQKKENQEMKYLRKSCIDCGSEAVETLIDEIKPTFRMEIVRYACGAEFKSSFSSRSNMGTAVHSGCMEN